MNKRFSLARVAAGVFTVGSVAAANAAVDVTAITAAGGDVALVGAAVFAVIIGIKVFQWIRRAA